MCEKCDKVRKHFDEAENLLVFGFTDAQMALWNALNENRAELTRVGLENHSNDYNGAKQLLEESKKRIE